MKMFAVIAVSAVLCLGLASCKTTETSALKVTSSTTFDDMSHATEEAKATTQKDVRQDTHVEKDVGEVKIDTDTTITIAATPTSPGKTIHKVKHIDKLPVKLVADAATNSESKKEESKATAVDEHKTGAVKVEAEASKTVKKEGGSFFLSIKIFFAIGGLAVLGYCFRSRLAKIPALARLGLWIVGKVNPVAGFLIGLVKRLLNRGVSSTS